MFDEREATFAEARVREPGWRALAIATMAFGSSARAQAEREYVVSDAIPCARCSLESTTRLRFTSATVDGEVSELPFGVRRDAKGQFWVLAQGLAPRIYDARGRYVSTFGRTGQGPGEFAAAEDMFWVSGDSLVIIDGGNRRATVFAPDGRPVRQLRTSARLVSASIVQWPARVLVSGTLSSPSSLGLPLHLASFDGSEVRMQQSFGPVGATALPRERTTTFHLTALGGRAVIATARPDQNQIYLWTADGRREATLLRRAPWFPDTSSGRIGTPTIPPSPAITALEVDADGMIWVFTRVPAKTWSSAWSRVPPGAREVLRGQVAYPLLFSTRVDVLDPIARRLVATMTLEGLAVSALGHGLVAMYGKGIDGDVLRVDELRLTR